MHAIGITSGEHHHYLNKHGLNKFTGNRNAVKALNQGGGPVLMTSQILQEAAHSHIQIHMPSNTLHTHNQDGIRVELSTLLHSQSHP
jgi:hypothetical protein